MYRWYLGIWMLSLYLDVKPLSISFHNKTFRSLSLLYRQGIDLGPKEVRIHREAGTMSIALPAHVVLAVENCKTKLKAGRLLLKWPPVLEGYEKEPFLQDRRVWLVIVHKSCWSMLKRSMNLLSLLRSFSNSIQFRNATWSRPVSSLWSSWLPIL